MSKRFVAIFALAAVLALDGPTLMADHGDKGDKHQQGNKHSNDHDDQAWQPREGYEYRMYTGDERPPGWSHGKKTGWGDCGLPSGEAKKHGCRTYVSQGRPYYYYQEDDGRIIVRRPAIEVHASVDITH